jgi:predicted SnoaL-like aldol condensation-catalyzing enzyme
MQPNRLRAIWAACLVTLIIACNQEAKQGTTAETPAKKQENKDVETVKSFYPALENGDWPTIEKISAPDFVDHSPWVSPEGVKGRDSLLKALKDYKIGFPNMKYEILHTATDGDLIFVHYRFTGSNDGPMMGMPATNKKLDYMGVDLIRMKEGLVAEHWDYGDNITSMKQMGLMQ